MVRSTNERIIDKEGKRKGERGRKMERERRG